MSFIVKYSNIYTTFWAVQEKLSAQVTALTTLREKVVNFVEYAEFQGSLAQSSKDYLNEVHIPMIDALLEASQLLMDDMVVYKASYTGLEMESGEDTVSTTYIFTEELMNDYAALFPTIAAELDEADSEALSQINSISDIISLTAPSVENIDSYSAALNTRIGQIITDVTAIEDQMVTLVEQTVDLIRAELSNAIHVAETSIGKANTYVSGSFISSPDGELLNRFVEASAEYRASQQEYVSSLWELENQIREACAAREQQGIMQMITGALLIVGGGICIVCSFGAATPAVVAIGMVAGAGTVTFGVYDSGEGADNISLAAQGDINTVASNNLKYGLFRGNEQAYMITEQAFAFAASAMCPIAKTATATNVITREGGVAIAKLVVSTGAGYGGSAIAGQFTDNQYVKLGAGMAASMLTAGGLNVADRHFGWSTGVPDPIKAPWAKGKAPVELEVGKADLDALRSELGVPETDTIAVGKTDVPGLENEIFSGESPKVRKEAGLPDIDEVWSNRNIKAPGKNPLFTRHAEEVVANSFDKAVMEAGLNPEEVTGTLKIHQSNPTGVCKKCIQGLANDKVSPGVLKQLSLKYPNLRIEVTSEIVPGVNVTGKSSFVIMNGGYVQ